MPASTDLRLRVPSPGLLALPWDQPLEQWQREQADLRELPVGPSRHLVRFVHADDQLWAIKELPERVAAREYAVLRQLEQRALPAVRAAGLALQHETENALLVTRYLDGSWQFRRRLLRLPPNRPRHRARLLDAMATLLVDLAERIRRWGGTRHRDEDSGGGGGPVGALVGPPASLLRLLAPLVSRAMQAALPGGRDGRADLSAVSLTRYPPGLVAALEKLRTDGTAVHSAVQATAHLWIAPPLAVDRSPQARPGLGERIDSLREL